MFQHMKNAPSRWHKDFRFKTENSAVVSTLSSLIFALYNGVLGIVYHSVWNSSICIYYLLLAGIRGLVAHFLQADILPEKRRIVCRWVHRTLIVLNLSLFVPIALMIRGERSYTYGLIPAIAMAVYTTYRIVIGIMHFKKSRKCKHILLAELNRIYMIDALVAVLALQNALIIAQNGSVEGMQTLTSWTSAGIQALIVAVSFMPIRENTEPHSSIISY